MTECCYCHLTLRISEQNVKLKLDLDLSLSETAERESTSLKPLQFIPSDLFITWLNCHFCSLQNAFLFPEKWLVLKFSVTHVAIHFVCALNIDLFTTWKFDHFGNIGNLLPLISWVWLWDYRKCNLIGPHVREFQADSIFSNCSTYFFRGWRLEG